MVVKVTLIAVLLLWSMGLLSEAQTTTPDCSDSVTDLIPCYTFLEGLDDTPSGSCCTNLESVYATQPICLCELINSAGNLTLSLPVTINVTKALDLPGLCNVAANPSQCLALITGAPSGSPFPAPLIIGGGPDSGASRKIPGTILSIVQFAAAPAIASLLLNVYKPAIYNRDGLL